MLSTDISFGTYAKTVKTNIATKIRNSIMRYYELKVYRQTHKLHTHINLRNEKLNFKVYRNM